MKLSDLISGEGASKYSTAQAKPLYWVGYVRVSTEDQYIGGQSLPAQKRAIIEESKREAALLHDEIFEDHASAYDSEDNRPNFARMIDFVIQDPRVTHIVAHDSSRFYRQRIKAESLIDHLNKLGITVLFLTEPPIDETSPYAPLQKALQHGINEVGSRITAMHTRKGMRENIQQRDSDEGYCYKNGCSAPWGFRRYKVERGIKFNEPNMKTLWCKDARSAIRCRQIVSKGPYWVSSKMTWRN